MIARAAAPQQPIWDLYRCDSCGFVRHRREADEPRLTVCPHCTRRDGMPELEHVRQITHEALRLRDQHQAVRLRAIAGYASSHDLARPEVSARIAEELAELFLELRG